MKIHLVELNDASFFFLNNRTRDRIGNDSSKLLPDLKLKICSQSLQS